VIELPANLAEAVTDDEVMLRWVATLPERIAESEARWSLAIEAPFQPGGVTAWVARARNRAGEPVVLKLGWRHEESMHEADALRAWDGNGAVRLLDSATTDDTAAMLLEECRPGTPLSDVRAPTAQDEVIAGLLQRLWIEPAAEYPFRELHSMCALWADEFVEKRAATGDIGLSDDIVEAGIHALRTLPTTDSRQVLLCTDLHAENILAAEREPWLAVDPKPYIGDPAYDPVQYMLDATERLSADPLAFVARMATLLDLDPVRLRHWVFARCVQECIDTPELAGVARALVRQLG